MAKLHEYSAKRRFNATPEPAPAVPEASAGPLLFVVQQHAARQLHYDFRIECDGVLHSWAVPKGPSLDPADKRLAVYVENHPYEYASFEGVIPPKQYGSGEVIVWDCGVYSPDSHGETDPDGAGTWFHDRAEAERRVRDGIAAGKLSLLLRGTKLKGSFALVRTKDAKTWLLIKHKDRFAGPVDITTQDRSPLSGLAVCDLKTVPVKRMPATQLAPTGDISRMPSLSPMLAEIGEAPLHDDDWCWEPKLDGYRVMAYLSGDEVRLKSRRGLDYTQAFPALVDELRLQLVDGMVLDGEIVAFGSDGKPSFKALQNRVQLKTARELAAADRSTPVVYFCFDLPWFAGIDLREAAYRDRRRYLAQCLLPSPHVQLVHAATDGVALQDAALASGFEGVVGKRLDSRYLAGKRSPSWLKVKPVQSGEFVVGGFTSGKGSRAALGALLVGYWDKGKLRFASGLGSGFDAKDLKLLPQRLQPLVRKTRPFAEQPDVPGAITWVKPELVVEVEFHEWTPDDHLRAPVFLRVREDIDPKSVKRPPSKSTKPSFPRKRESMDVAPPLAKNAKSLDSSLRSSLRDQPAAAPRASRLSRLRGNDKSGANPRASHPGDAIVADVLEQLTDKRKTFELAIGEHRIKLTNLDRVYWPPDEALQSPALTKRDLLRYLAHVSPLMLPHLADRPLTMIRMPDGIDGQRFFQKHWTQARPEFTRTVTVYSGSKDEEHEYLLCNDLQTLLWLAQSGTLEFHVWHSRAKVDKDSTSKSTDYASSLESLEASVLNYPDYVVFDIDPYIYSGKEKPGDEPELNTVAFEKGKEIAFALREVLQEMSLGPIVKTSGKTGLHVFVPIRRSIDFDAAREVSELVSRHLMRRRPQDITMEWAVTKRSGKIFMDHNMNVRGKTLNAAYSPRGAPGAPVSMPLDWEELAGAHPLDFRIPGVIKRLERTGDRWRDALTRKQDLGKALGNKGKRA